MPDANKERFQLTMILGAKTFLWCGAVALTGAFGGALLGTSALAAGISYGTGLLLFGPKVYQSGRETFLSGRDYLRHSDPEIYDRGPTRAKGYDGKDLHESRGSKIEKSVRSTTRTAYWIAGGLVVGGILLASALTGAGMGVYTAMLLAGGFFGYKIYKHGKKMTRDYQDVKDHSKPQEEKNKRQKQRELSATKEKSAEKFMGYCGKFVLTGFALAAASHLLLGGGTLSAIFATAGWLGAGAVFGRGLVAHGKNILKQTDEQPAEPDLKQHIRDRQQQPEKQAQKQPEKQPIVQKNAQQTVQKTTQQTVQKSTGRPQYTVKSSSVTLAVGAAKKKVR